MTILAAIKLAGEVAAAVALIALVVFGVAVASVSDQDLGEYEDNEERVIR